jgi:hypothetical protein
VPRPRRRLRLKRLALPVALLVALSAAVLTPGAFAGAKFATAYDPTHHAAVTSDTIHIYSFRWLLARSPVMAGYGAPSRLDGHGLLRERLLWSPSCKLFHRGCIRSIKVRFALTRRINCSAQEIYGNGSVYSRLYVRPLPYDAARPWRELGHYHAVVKADC